MTMADPTTAEVHDNHDDNVDDDGDIPTSQKPRQQRVRRRRQCYNIAMVCDFFFPRTGGVENHIWSLSQHLIRLGHKVIVVTHSYSGNSSKNNRRGVRYLPGPLKVYYCPFIPMTDQDILPTLTSTFPLWRHIMIRENIDIVHTHQATSVMTNESLVYGSALGIPTVFTDHSLFQLDDVAGVVLNRVLETTLSQVSAVICVSHACRDNLILRARLHQTSTNNDDDNDGDNGQQQKSNRRRPIIAVIPNAVDSSKFTPFDDNDNDTNAHDDTANDMTTASADGYNDDNPTIDNSNPTNHQQQQRINIVVVSRLVYRKGVDLLVGIIPKICALVPNVDFIIGGDGNKLLSLQEMVEYHHLQDRVEFLGSVPHVNVASVLRRGSIFLNCSLTESFCIAILEAASCGLLVVSTNVGGVPEVLPENDMIVLCDPNVDSLVDGLKHAIERQSQSQSPPSQPQKGHELDVDTNHHNALLPPVDPLEAHNRITHMYSWHRVAVQTVHEIYDKIVVIDDDGDDDDDNNKNHSNDTHTVSKKSKQQRNRRASIQPFRQRLFRFHNQLGGGLASIVACILATYIELWIRYVEYTQPADKIDVVPDLVPRATDDHDGGGRSIIYD